MYWHIAAVASIAWTLDGCGKKKGDLFWPYLVSAQVVAGFRVLPEGKRSEAVEPSKGEFADCVSDVFRRLTLRLSIRMGSAVFESCSSALGEQHQAPMTPMLKGPCSGCGIRW